MTRLLHTTLALFSLWWVGCVQVELRPAEPVRPSRERTQANQDLDEKERRDGRFVGLAISGGGSRAAVFGGAVLKELDRLGLLQQVDVLSAVSGGALPAAYYTLDGYRDVNFADGFVDRVGYDFQRDVLGEWLSPSNLFRYWFTEATRSNTVIQVLDDKLFHGATYADLNPARPKLLLNSTNALTGEPFVISDENFSGLHLSLASFSLARAVYMSAAYPGLFEPIALHDGDSKTAGPHRPSVLAYDGGPVDNLGVRTLITMLNDALVTESRERLFPKGCLVISVDATPRRTKSDEPLSAAAVLLKSNRRDMLELAGIPARDQDIVMFSTFPVGRGENGGLCRFWHIALRQLPDDDPLGARVTRIPTNLGLDRADQDALISAAVRLVERGRAEAGSLQDIPVALLRTRQEFPGQNFSSKE